MSVSVGTLIIMYFGKCIIEPIDSLCINDDDGRVTISCFQLCNDAVSMEDRIIVIRDGVFIVSLFDNVLLRVELAYHPFEEGCASETDV